MQVPAGSPIPISLQLWDGNNGAFVKAFLKNEQGAPYSPSSIDLQNVGNGLYLNSTLLMPVSGVILASLFVFTDGTYLVPDDNYTASSDIFSVQSSGGGGGGSVVNGGSVVGYVIDANPLVGVVESDQATGEVANTSLTGQIDSSQAEGEVQSDSENITGKIEC